MGNCAWASEGEETVEGLLAGLQDRFAREKRVFKNPKSSTGTDWLAISSLEQGVDIWVTYAMC